MEEREREEKRREKEKRREREEKRREEKRREEKRREDGEKRREEKRREEKRREEKRREEKRREEKRREEKRREEKRREEKRREEKRREERERKRREETKRKKKKKKEKKREENNINSDFVCWSISELICMLGTAPCIHRTSVRKMGKWHAFVLCKTQTWITIDAVVTGLQVRFQFHTRCVVSNAISGMCILQFLRPEHMVSTRSRDVGLAPDVAHVQLHTSIQPHPSVVCLSTSRSPRCKHNEPRTIHLHSNPSLLSMSFKSYMRQFK